MFTNDIYMNVTLGLYCVCGEEFVFKLIYVYEVSKPTKEAKENYVTYYFWDFTQEEDNTFKSTDKHWIECLVPVNDLTMIGRSESVMQEHVDNVKADMRIAKSMEKVIKAKQTDDVKKVMDILDVVVTPVCRPRRVSAVGTVNRKTLGELRKMGKMTVPKLKIKKR